MQIDMLGPGAMLEEIRLRLEDQLEKKGYREGPKFDSMEGVMVNYTKGEDIISIQVSEEAEGRECSLHVESEVEILELNEIWDAALVSYGVEVLRILKSHAIDKQRIERELK